MFVGEFGECEYKTWEDQYTEINNRKLHFKESVDFKGHMCMQTCINYFGSYARKEEREIKYQTFD